MTNTSTRSPNHEDKPKSKRIAPIEVAIAIVPHEIMFAPGQYSVTSTVAEAINTEIANYNRTGNALSLWAVLALCIKNGIPVPAPTSADSPYRSVGDFFVEVAEKLIAPPAPHEPPRRDIIDDIVLGTLNSGGGPSVFQKRPITLRNERIIAMTSELLAGNIEKRRTAKFQTITSIYKKVAEAFDVTEDTVKRLVTDSDGDDRTFNLRALQRTIPDEDGFIELPLPDEKPPTEK